MAFCIKISEEKCQWWCHPSMFDSMFLCLSKLFNNKDHRKDLCLFSMLGPESGDRIIPKEKIECQEKIMQIKDVDILKNSDMTKESGEIFITALPG